MSSIRINKIALELNVQNDQIIEELQKKDIMVKNYMSAIDEKAANYIRTVFSKAPETKLKKAAPSSKAKKATKTKTAKTAVKKKTAAKKSTTVKKKATTKTKTAKTAVKKKTVKKTAVKKTAKKATKTKTEPSGRSAPVVAKAVATKTQAKPETRDPKVIRKLGLKIVKKEEKPKLTKPKAPPPKPVQKQEPAKAKPAKAKTVVAPPPKHVKPSPPVHEEVFEKVALYDAMSLRDLSEVLKCSPNEIIRDLMAFGVMATINQTLDVGLASKVADKMGFEVEIVSPKLDLLEEEEEEEDLKEDHKRRPPIVTIMGHVDHGKTSLLDVIRETSVTKGEHGGITQHIGAYQTKIKDQMITFLDTPGHEAFTAMRARGAQVTDIVVLVVAADDGIKPQTLEAIDHAKAANVQIVVAINKIDKHDANPEEVKKQLAAQGLLPEDWGGQTIFTEVSALKNTGIEHLLEMLLLQEEILECKANPEVMAKGVVIESKLDKGRGPVATVIVEKGTLKIGQPFIVGCYFGRVRAMVNHKGKKILEAGPSTPVEVLGIPEVPQPGDKFMVVRDEKRARQISSSRIQKQRESYLAQSERITLEDLHQQIQEGEIKELNMIVKADVQGSIQAVKEAFSKLETSDVRIKVIHDAVGGITESDILLASASNALVIGFNVRLTEKASPLAAREKVDVRLYNIIYDAIDEMKKALAGMLEPKFKEKTVGRAEVREVFTIPKAGVIAGCSVLSGYMERNLNTRLIRDDVVVYQGKTHSLRRFKEDVKTVQSGYECGVALDKYQDIKRGDIIEPFILEEVKR